MDRTNTPEQRRPALNALTAYALARLTAGLPVNGELQTVAPAWRSTAEYLAGLPPEERGAAFNAIVHGPGLDHESVVRAIADADPTGPPPEGEPPRRFATIGDVRRALADVRWLWEGWIPSARIIGIAGFEGCGKTRFGLDLCRRIYHRQPWPDGQLPTLPAGTRSIWLCADGHQDELGDEAVAFGLPDDAIVFPTPVENVYGGVDLDDRDTIEALDAAVGQVKPALVLVDTLTSATSKDLCDQRSMKPLKTPLVDLAQRHQVTIVLLLHLSREGQALGRRIKGITRTLIHLECPDVEQPARLRLWVEKSYSKKPPSLGVTMRDGGNDYDFNPPRAPEPAKLGRPAGERSKAEAFILEALARQDNRVGNELCAEWETKGGKRNTFWRAVDELEKAERVATEGGNGKGKQKTIRLASGEAPDPSLDAF